MIEAVTSPAIQTRAEADDINLTRSELFLLKRLRQLQQARQNGIMVIVEVTDCRLKWRVAGRIEG